MTGDEGFFSMIFRAILLQYYCVVFLWINMPNNLGNFSKVAFLAICEISHSSKGEGMAQVAQWQICHWEVVSPSQPTWGLGEYCELPQ